METKEKSPARSRKKRRIQLYRERWYRLLGMAFVGVLAVFVIINLLKGDREFSENENRNLAQKPEFSKEALLNGQYFSDVDDYLSDQFFARDQWLSLNFMMKKYTGSSENGGVFLGKDDYLLEKPNDPNETALQNSEDAIRAFAAAHQGINMQMMLIPCQEAVRPELLPDGAPVRDQLADIASIQADLADAVGQIDAVSALKEDTQEQLYYRTDHHWTSRGARTAFMAAAPALGITDPILYYDSYLVSDSFRGTLSSKSGDNKPSDQIEVFVPQENMPQYYVYLPDTKESSGSLYVSEKLKEKDQYQVFLGGNHPYVEISTTADTGKNLLIFKDSYANCFVQFLVPYYDKIVVVDPRYYYDNINTAMTSTGITDVLFLYSANTFVQDTTLSDVLNAAG